MMFTQQLQRTSASLRPCTTGSVANVTPKVQVMSRRASTRHIARAEGPSSPQEPSSPQGAPQGEPSAPQAPSNAFTPNAAAPSVEEVMGFSGAPEIINGRLAMLGFVAALGAELASGDSVLKQLSEEPTLITLTFITFAAASLVPAFARRQGDALGPFTPKAEMTNGRAAMIGFAAMLILEGVRGTALF